MSRKKWVAELIASVAGVDIPTADMVVERLMEEGLLVLGYGDKDVERIVVTFTDTFGTTKTSRYDRFAARRLADTHTAQAVCGIISLLGKARDERYAPVIRSVADLETKWVSVENFLRKLYRGDEMIAI